MFFSANKDFDREIDVTSKIALISSDKNLIDVMFIPESIQKLVMDNDTRSMFNSCLINPNIKLLKKLERIPSMSESISFNGFSIDIQTGLPLIKVWRGDGVEKMFLIDLHSDPKHIVSRPELSSKEFEDSLKEAGNFSFNVDIVDLVNGFCKLISELPSRKKIVLDDETKVISSNTNQDIPWNSVNIGEVRNLNEQPDTNLIIIGKGNSSEKRYHKRRGHWRKYRNDDDSIKCQKWIEETSVREDKKETENLKGSAIILKEE